MFCKKRPLKYLTKLTGKHMYRSLFFKSFSMKACSFTFQSQIIGRGVVGGLNKRGGSPTDNLNINKRGIQIKSGGLKNVIGQKRQPVITNYGCPKQPVAVKKHQYNSLSSLRLYIKQNRTFLITNLSNVNTKICLRNQTRLCIHLLLVPSH